MGRRPIVEIMWADFSLVALDQLVNQAANIRYVSQGRLTAPITVRTQQGTAPGACAQHSQCLEAIFLHVPGLRVAMPATPQDAYDVLLSSVACEDPVIVIENRTLYSGLRTDVICDGQIQPIGGAVKRRDGSDVTVVTWGAMQAVVLDAAERLAVDGVELDIIDLRWLNPCDTDAILESTAKTGRLMVVHEANRTGGFGAEIVARTAEAGLTLSSPPVRLGLDDVRVPAAPSLLAAVVPGVEQVVKAGRTLARR
jgi:pyruvate/2-oxoglutarate/acetoin dehydrogenase E1 component